MKTLTTLLFLIVNTTAFAQPSSPIKELNDICYRENVYEVLTTNYNFYAPYRESGKKALETYIAKYQASPYRLVAISYLAQLLEKLSRVDSSILLYKQAIDRFAPLMFSSIGYHKKLFEAYLKVYTKEEIKQAFLEAENKIEIKKEYDNSNLLFMAVTRIFDKEIKLSSGSWLPSHNLPLSSMNETAVAVLPPSVKKRNNNNWLNCLYCVEIQMYNNL